MDKKNKENHEKYAERIKLFKRCGYDVEKERDFIIDRVQPIKGKILEVGTGKGHFAMALAQKGYEFTTVDISEEEQKFAKMNIQYLGLQNQVTFVVGNAQKLDFPDRNFDVSFAINLIHHLENPLKVIDEMLRVTQDRGNVVISDFNKEGFSIIKKIHQDQGGNHDSGLCTLHEIAAYAKGKGMQIKKFTSKCQDLIIICKTKGKK